MDPKSPHTPPQAPYQNPPQPPQGPQQYNQPVAYDQQGRPLYAHPPQQPLQPQPQQPPQMVYMSRPVAPVDPHIPEEVQKRHKESLKKYPQLNLSEGEYVISAVRRHPIGLLQIWGIAFILMVALAATFTATLLSEDSFLMDAFDDPQTATTLGTAVLGVIFTMIGLGAFVASYVYNNNRFFLTNESVIQEIQTSLFHRHEQTVSLSNIEDASFKQNGIISSMLNYGTIRLSTEGDETTYRFTYVASPKRHIAVLNNAVEAFKNGRPVELPANHPDQPS